MSSASKIAESHSIRAPSTPHQLATDTPKGWSEYIQPFGTGWQGRSRLDSSKTHNFRERGTWRQRDSLKHSILLAETFWCYKRGVGQFLVKIDWLCFDVVQWFASHDLEVQLSCLKWYNGDWGLKTFTVVSWDFWCFIKLILFNSW